VEKKKKRVLTSNGSVGRGNQRKNVAERLEKQTSPKNYIKKEKIIRWKEPVHTLSNQQSKKKWKTSKKRSYGRKLLKEGHE